MFINAFSYLLLRKSDIYNGCVDAFVTGTSLNVYGSFGKETRRIAPNILYKRYTNCFCFVVEVAVRFGK